jgi:hypothetical protein
MAGGMKRGAWRTHIKNMITAEHKLALTPAKRRKKIRDKSGAATRLSFFSAGARRK